MADPRSAPSYGDAHARRSSKYPSPHSLARFCYWLPNLRIPARHSRARQACFKVLWLRMLPVPDRNGGPQNLSIQILSRSPSLRTKFSRLQTSFAARRHSLTAWIVNHAVSLRDPPRKLLHALVSTITDSCTHSCSELKINTNSSVASQTTILPTQCHIGCDRKRGRAGLSLQGACDSVACAQGHRAVSWLGLVATYFCNQNHVVAPVEVKLRECFRN